MNTSKGFINLLWLVAIVVIILGGGAAWWVTQKSKPAAEDIQPVQLPIVKEESTNVVQKSVTMQTEPTLISKYLTQVKPQFVTRNEPIDEELAKAIRRVIADELTIQLIKESQGINGAEEQPDPVKAEDISLFAVGKRYVYFNQGQAKDCGGPDMIIDSVTMKTTIVSEEHILTRDTSWIFIGQHAFYAYTADSAGLMEIPGSRIAENERYRLKPEQDGMCSGGVAYLFKDEDTSVTLQIDSSRGTDPKTGEEIPGPSRTITFALPQ